MTRHREGLKPESYLAILSHHAYKGEGEQKEVAVGTGIQEKQQGNDDRHQRWARLARADLFAQYGDLQVQGLSQRQAAQMLDSIGIPILRLPSRPRDTRARWGEEGTCHMRQDNPGFPSLIRH